MQSCVKPAVQELSMHAGVHVNTQLHTADSVCSIHVTCRAKGVNPFQPHNWCLPSVYNMVAGLTAAARLSWPSVANLPLLSLHLIMFPSCASFNQLTQSMWCLSYESVNIVRREDAKTSMSDWRRVSELICECIFSQCAYLNIQHLHTFADEASNQYMSAYVFISCAGLSCHSLLLYHLN